MFKLKPKDKNHLSKLAQEIAIAGSEKEKPHIAARFQGILFEIAVNSCSKRERKKD